MKRSLRRILGYRWLDSVFSGPPSVHVISLSPPEYQSQVCARHTPFGELLCPPRRPPYMVYVEDPQVPGWEHWNRSPPRSTTFLSPAVFCIPPSLQLQSTSSDSDSDPELKRTLETGSQFYLKDDKILQFCALNDFFLSQLKIMGINVKLNEKKRKISPSLFHVVRQLFLLYSG